MKRCSEKGCKYNKPIYQNRCGIMDNIEACLDNNLHYFDDEPYD